MILKIWFYKSTLLSWNVKIRLLFNLIPWWMFFLCADAGFSSEPREVKIDWKKNFSLKRFSRFLSLEKVFEFLKKYSFLTFSSFSHTSRAFILISYQSPFSYNVTFSCHVPLSHNFPLTHHIPFPYQVTSIHNVPFPYQVTSTHNVPFPYQVPLTDVPFQYQVPLTPNVPFLYQVPLTRPFPISGSFNSSLSHIRFLYLIMYLTIFPIIGSFFR